VRRIRWIHFQRGAKWNGGHPKAIVFLACDAFGVMPPVARLNPAQAMYHFYGGLHGRVGGHGSQYGQGPTPTFSTCFGAPFLPLPPQTYAKMRRKRMRTHDRIAICSIRAGWGTRSASPANLVEDQSRQRYANHRWHVEQGGIPQGPERLGLRYRRRCQGSRRNCWRALWGEGCG